MSRSPALSLDLLIIGGGIAGLWLLNRAVQDGHHAVLIEKDALGGGQTIHSQGIIHGGTKYTLGAAASRAAEAIAAMPARWRACLGGSGELDLRAARKLADATVFWAEPSLRARVTSFVASKALRSRVDAGGTRPEPLAGVRGTLYDVDEPVLDIPSVIEALAAPMRDRIRQADGDALTIDYEEDGSALVSIGDIVLRPQRIVVTAGEGMVRIAERLGVAQASAQTRPLHMVALRHRGGAALYGHCIGASSVPVLTITSHPQGADMVWYLGGGLAEAGVDRDAPAQIAAAEAALSRALPGVRPTDPRWATLRINRAEPDNRGRRPDAPVAQAVGNTILAWPTKLALAPDLADRVLAMLPPPRAERGDLAALAALATPPVARPFWERM